MVVVMGRAPARGVLVVVVPGRRCSRAVADSGATVVASGVVVMGGVLVSGREVLRRGRVRAGLHVGMAARGAGVRVGGRRVDDVRSGLGWVGVGMGVGAGALGGGVCVVGHCWRRAGVKMKVGGAWRAQAGLYSDREGEKVKEEGEHGRLGMGVRVCISSLSPPIEILQILLPMFR